MGEFHNDAQRDSYIAGLRDELANHEAKVTAAKLEPQDKDAMALHGRLVKEVKAELKRVGASDEADAPAADA